MLIHEWCIAVLKGKSQNIRFTELYSLCTKHYKESEFNSEEELLTALEPFKDYFLFEDFMYDYVTFEDDEKVDTPILELAKDVLRSHSNRYTLEVLCRKMNENEAMEVLLDAQSLKSVLSARDCFRIERRSITLFKLSQKGEAYDIEPIVFKKLAKTEEQKQKESEKRIAKEQERQLRKAEIEKERLLRKAIREQERERKREQKQKRAEHKKELRIEKLKKIISYYKITDETTLDDLWANKLIRKDEQTKCNRWGLYTVGQVYNWVDERNLPERIDDYRRHTVRRMLKIASFHDPDLARLIPNVKFSGIQKANRAIRLSQFEGRMVNGKVVVKRGEALRWNYSKEEGVVVGFDSSSGERNFIVQQCDGKKIIFENDPKLFTILDGEEKETVVSKWKKYIKDRREARNAFLPKPMEKTETDE